MYLNIFLQAAPGGGGGGMGMMIMFGLMFVVMYFFMIRPQQKKAKEQAKFRESIKAGEYIVTIGGLHGRIQSVESDDTIIVEVDKGFRMKFEKSSVSPELTKKYQEKDKAKA